MGELVGTPDGVSVGSTLGTGVEGWRLGLRLGVNVLAHSHNPT